MSDDTLSDNEWATLAAIAEDHELIQNGEVLRRLQESGLVEQVDGAWCATPAGRAMLQAR